MCGSPGAWVRGAIWARVGGGRSAGGKMGAGTGVLIEEADGIMEIGKEGKWGR